jgi:hypothetical protein
MIYVGQREVELDQGAHSPCGKIHAEVPGRSEFRLFPNESAPHIERLDAMPLLKQVMGQDGAINTPAEENPGGWAHLPIPCWLASIHLWLPGNKLTVLLRIRICFQLRWEADLVDAPRPHYTSPPQFTVFSHTIDRDVGLRFTAGLGRGWFSESKLLQLEAGLLEWN